MALAGIVLAGGTSSRLGADKALVTLAGEPLVSRVTGRLAPQVDRLVLNANGDVSRFPALGLPLVADAAPSRGPLSGILAGMRWALAELGADTLLLSVPVDTPFVPRDLAARLLAARLESDMPITVATSSGRVHNAVALWPAALAPVLADWLAAADKPAVYRFGEEQGITEVSFDASDYDPFFNINAHKDLAAAEMMEEAMRS